ncbi:MAG: prolyl oligopeptidase family serine peptidase [Phycisphaerales bacterium JB039]
MYQRPLAAVLVSILALVAGAPAQQAEKAEKEDALTLERIFPEKSFFGPSARSTSFSHDGRFGAFLYQPWEERRHGTDLYIYDTATGQPRRITAVSRMAEFQKEAREVQEDREKKAKKAGVTLAELARQQQQRLGVPVSGVVGEWEGEADSTSRRGAIRPGDCVLTLSAKLDGELRIGLVRLPVSKGKLEDGKFTAKVADKDLEVEGALELTLEDATLEGSLTLEKPDLDFTLRLERAEPDTEAGAEGPRGVIGALGERLALGDVVLDDDATINDEDDEGKRPDKLAPRYGGVDWYEWSPLAHELLLLSDGDIYRLTIDLEAWDAEFTPSGDEPVAPYRGDLSRLTRTREREGSVQYLPDGAGYTYLRDGALLEVAFEGSLIKQLDPELKDNERMVGYRISPDRKRLVFLANRGASYWGSGREINIVNYRDRFASVRRVTRHMPDDPFPEAWSSVYLYDLDGHDREEGTLQRVFTRRISGPRDTMAVPHWAPDSSRVAFAAFEQSTGLIKILEAGFEEQEPEAAPDEKAEDKSAESAEEDDIDGDRQEEQQEEQQDEQDQEEGQQAQQPEAGEAEEEGPDFKIEDARVVYQFLHAGGPNTPGMVMPQYLPDSRRMVFITELSGFRQLHLLDPAYEQLTQLTEGRYEIYPFDISEDHATLFATATKDDPAQEHIYSVDTETGAMTRLSTTDGVYGGVAVSDDGAHILATHVDFGAPRELIAIDRAHEAPETARLTDSHSEEAHKLTQAAPEYFSFENRHGQTIHGHMFKPKDWSPEDKRPLLIYVYGGPLGETKMATRGSFGAPSYFFARYMTEVHGWVTATVDPRGASGYGAVFEKANFEQVGKPQTEDLVDAAHWLVENAGVDEKRMALHGWSFGGFQTQMVMYTEPDVFAAGIAGAGPTEWHNYNSWYSTGTIGDNKPGKTDLEKFSLLPLAKNLKGQLLLVHGVEDSNVLYQDTVRVYRELLKADKETLVELFIDPTGGHGLGGDVKTINRYRKYESFLLRTIGAFEAEADEQPADDAAAPADEGDDSGAEGGT